jgi:hypothetical protein
MSWIYLGIAAVVAYVLALIFVVPNTEEAHMGASALFASFGVSYAAYSYLIWKER